MSKREIIVSISDVGDVKFEGKGFVGRTCDQYMEPLEKALAGTGEIEKQYDERWAKNEAVQTATQRW